MRPIGKWVIVCIDLLLISLVTWRTIEIDNDKMYIFFAFFYAVIVGLNLLVWLTLALLKNSLRKEVGWIVGCLVILFIFLMSYISSL